jgi:hypothetical protein
MDLNKDIFQMKYLQHYKIKCKTPNASIADVMATRETFAIKNPNVPERKD